jgi:hypothetical protein
MVKAIWRAYPICTSTTWPNQTGTGKSSPPTKVVHLPNPSLSLSQNAA